MRKVNIFKKLSFYNIYKKAIRANSVELENKFGLRIDDANRLYTVINIPEELVGDAYSLRKSDIDRISDNYIREYSSELGIFLNSKGVSELYDFYDLKKVDKYSYLVVIGFSMFRSDIRRERIMKYWLPIGSLVLVTSVLLMIFL